MSVCGIDLGSFKSPSYIAWLQDKHFLFDIYIPSKEAPLPKLNLDISYSTHFAIDGPQSLPVIENKRRECDRLANTPTSILPKNRHELSTWKMYKQLIECGIEVFWSAHKNGFASIGGTEESNSELPIIIETYPRYIIKRLWDKHTIPSKRKAPIEYVNNYISLIKSLGYSFDETKIWAPDYIDAMLCAIAAEDYLLSNGNCLGKVGIPPILDEGNQIFREGYIYSP